MADPRRAHSCSRRFRNLAASPSRPTWRRANFGMEQVSRAES